MSTCLERSNGESTHTYSTYGYNNEHVVIVYTAVKDTQSEFGQPRHVFKSLHFGPFILKRNPGVFKLKRGGAAFSKVSIADLENAGVE